MPTRRIMEVALVVTILARPAFGVVHLEAQKILQRENPGSFWHGVAEIVVVALA